MTDIEKLMAYAEAIGLKVDPVSTTQNHNAVRIGDRVLWTDDKGEIVRVKKY